MPRLLRNKKERVYTEFRDREGNLVNIDSATSSVYDSDGNIVVDADGVSLENRPMYRSRTGVYYLAIQFAAAQTVGNFYMWAEGSVQSDVITLDFPISIDLVQANFIPTETLCPMWYVKEVLRIATTEEDSYLYDLLLAADARVKAYCKRTFWTNTFTENYSGRGGTAILLEEYPVTSITSITDDDATIDSDDYTYTADGLVTLLESQEFSNVENGVVVVYVAGFSTIPRDLQLATALLVGYWRMMEGRGGLESEDVGSDYTYTRDAESLKDGLPAEVRQTLKGYRRLF